MQFKCMLNLSTLLILAVLGSATADYELLAVTLIHRHGDRPPLVFSPNDPYKDPSLWPALPGELTNKGKAQLYEIGKWLRSRYDGFLSQFYNGKEIYARSSDDDRCLMSAQAMLAGLYRPKGKDVWKENLPWQPIPIHTVPLELDDIAEVEDSCSKFSSLLREAEKLPRFVETMEKHKELLKFLSTKTGFDLSRIWHVWKIYDSLTIESMNNFSLPTWAIDALPKIEEISDISQELYTCTPLNLKLTIGRFYNELLSQFENILNGHSNIPKFKTFSAHDTQVFSALNGLKIEGIKMPQWAALIIFELRKSKNGNYYVQVFYRQGASVDLFQIPDCEQKCDFDVFKKKIEPASITSEEYVKECNN